MFTSQLYVPCTLHFLRLLSQLPTSYTVWLMHVSCKSHAQATQTGDILSFVWVQRIRQKVSSRRCVSWAHVHRGKSVYCSCLCAWMCTRQSTLGNCTLLFLPLGIFSCVSYLFSAIFFQVSNRYKIYRYMYAYIVFTIPAEMLWVINECGHVFCPRKLIIAQYLIHCDTVYACDRQRDLTKLTVQNSYSKPCIKS